MRSLYATIIGMAVLANSAAVFAQPKQNRLLYCPATNGYLALWSRCIVANGKKIASNNSIELPAWGFAIVEEE